MEVSEIQVETTKIKYLPLEETLLMPVGDCHFSNGGPTDPCDTERFKRHLDWGMKRSAWFLGMGDMLEIMSPSNRRALRGVRLYDSTQDMIEQAGNERLLKFLEVVKGTEGHWLGLLEGHHFMEFEDGTTSDTRVCSFLKAPFLGNCAFVHLNFKKPKASSASIGATIWCHHGTGGGQLVSAPLNLLERVVEHFEADIYLMGHQHKKVAAPIDRVYVSWRSNPPRVLHRRMILACTGGFLRAYMQGSKRRGRAQGTYVEKRMLSPTALGGIAVYIRPRRIREGDQDTYHLDLGVEQ